MNDSLSNEDRKAIDAADRDEAKRRRLEKGSKVDQFKAACVGTPLERIQSIQDALDFAMIPVSLVVAGWMLWTTWPQPGVWTWLSVAAVPLSIALFYAELHIRLQRMIIGRRVKPRGLRRDGVKGS